MNGSNVWKNNVDLPSWNIDIIIIIIIIIGLYKNAFALMSIWQFFLSQGGGQYIFYLRPLNAPLQKNDLHMLCILYNIV